MDNSDSEHFESADEDFQSDDETFEKPEATKSEPLLSKSRAEKLNEDYKTDSSKSDQIVNNYELTTIKKPNLELQDLEVKQDNVIIVHSNENSDKEEKDNKPNKTTKTNKSNIKSKLGSKTTKKLTMFEESPKKQKPEAVDKIEPVLKSEDSDERNKEVEKQNLASVDEIEPEFQAMILDKKSEDSKVIEDENLWEDDELDWGAESLEDSKTVQQPSLSNNTRITTNKEKQNEESDSWSSWGNWGVSVLSTATQSVSTITSQITNVIESGLGAVDPIELARIEQEERKKIKQQQFTDNKEKQQDNSEDIPYGGFGLGNLVKLVENTGTKVISGGLDTLETIGKKTMEVLQDGDPGLKKKRAFLKIDQDKPVLSQILREAKERSENESRTSEQTSKKKWKNYETLFDDHHGLVHLEALELLSKQCDIKLKNIQSLMTGDEYTDFSETMDQIKELCELPDEDDEEQMTIDEIKKRLEKAVSEMNIQITYEKLVANWEEMEIWLSTLDLDICDEKEVHQQAIETLAEITSRAMEQFHKSGELLLIKERRSTADEADSLVQITATLIALIGIVAAKFCEKLNSKVAQNKEVSGLITNVFFEAANSSSYIQDALQLLIPVLQVGAT